jgi:hypothetical protein
MSIPRRMLGGAAAAVVLLAAMGCEVDSRYPLSDEETSTPDLKLIGNWLEEGQSKNGTPWPIVKHSKTKNALMFDDPSGESKNPERLFTTTIGGKKYLSWEWRDEESKKTCFLICRYEMPDENTLDVGFLSKEAIRKAIADKHLVGEIRIITSKNDGLLGFLSPLKQETEVHIATDTKDLRAFLQAHGDSCFPRNERSDLDTVLHRVK